MLATIQTYSATTLAYVRANRTVSVLAVILIVGGYYVFFSGSEAATITYPVIREDVKVTVAVTGTVVAAEDADLGFAGSGRVAGIYAAVGQRVSAGKVLAALENGDAVALVAQREAELARVEAELASLQAGSRPEAVAIRKSAVMKAEAELRDAMRSAYVAADDAVSKQADQFFDNPRSSLASLTFGTANSILENRLEAERVALEPVLSAWSLTLGSDAFATDNPEVYAESVRRDIAIVATFLEDASKALSLNASMAALYQDDINTARTAIAADASALSTALGVLVAARGDLALAEAGATIDDLAVKEASVRAARASVASARAELAKTLVTAPFSGVVAKMDVKRGEYVAANTSKVMLISDGAFQIETFVPQISVAAVAPDDTADVTLDAYGPSLLFTARVLSVDPAETLRDGVATYKTLLAFNTTDTRVRSGMTANVAITTAVLPDSVVIPAGAVERENDQAFVTLANGTRRAITLGETVSLGRVVVTSGLEDGDVILLTP